MDSTRVRLTDGLRYFFIIPSDQPTPTPTPTATATWWGKLVGVEGNKKERPRSENEREMNLLFDTGKTSLVTKDFYYLK